jgi:hypothetical protein
VRSVPCRQCSFLSFSLASAVLGEMDGNACAVDGTDVAGPHSCALRSNLRSVCPKRRPNLTDSCARTSLRRHRDEALQERGLGHYEQEHTNKRSRARWLMRLLFVLSRSCDSVYRCIARFQEVFSGHSGVLLVAVTNWRLRHCYRAISRKGAKAQRCF